MKPLDLEAIALLKAADYIDEHGWCQGEMSAEDGRVCAVGAITASTGGDNEPLQARLDAEYRLRKYVKSFVPDWNDVPGRTQAEVTAAMRAAALTAAEHPTRNEG